MTALSFGPWEPDIAGVDASVLAVAKNVWPTTIGYGPVPSLSAISTSALPAKCVGKTYARTASGGWLIFAGTRTKLYKYVSGAWTEVTRVAGGDYNVPVDEYWSFAQFGSVLMATNINDVVQSIDVDSGAANFAALAGTPPQARYVGVVGSFVVLACLSSDNRAIRNSAIESSIGWTVGTNLCDEQTLPDGGRVTGFAGGEFGYALQERSLRRMIFQPGNDIAFRYERLDDQHGAAAGYSLVSTANGIYFIANDGFYSYGYQGLVPIGDQRVNKWFQSNSDPARFFSVIAFSIPNAPRIAWAFYASAGSSNFDRVLFYDWKQNRWTYAELTAQYWASLTTPGVTLEDLDVYGDLDSGLIPYPFDSRAWEGGQPVIGAVDANGKLAFLEGSLPLTATFNTSPMHLALGYRSMVQSVYPLGVVNSAAPTIRVGRRENTQNAATYTDYTSPSTLSGVARFNATGRVHDFELTVTQTSGTSWTHIQGLNIEAQRQGQK